MKKARIVILFLIAFAFLTTVCGVKIIPKTEQEGIIDAKHNIITKEKNGLRITARSMDWRFDPYFLDEYFTPIGLGIHFFYSYRRSFSNIALYALPKGEIHPHAQVRGFVYFTRADQYGRELKIKLKIDDIEQEFEFILKK